MKNKILALFILFGSTQFVFSQESVVVSETVESINNENGSALKSTVLRAEDREILKEWKSFLKDYDAEVNIKGKEAIATEVMMKAISNESIEILMKVKAISDEEHEVYFIFKNKGSYISSLSDISGYTAAELIVKRFITNLNKETTEQHHKKVEKVLDDYTDELEDLVRKKEKAEKNIEDCKESIKENEYLIEKNKKDQSKLVKEIEAQKKKVRDAKKSKEEFN